MTNDQETKKTYSQFLARIAVFLGLVLQILGYIEKFIEKTIGIPIPQSLSIWIGFAVFAGGIIWFAFRAGDVPQKWRWTALGALYMATIAFSLWQGIQLAKGQRDSESEQTVVVPLQATRIFNFEEIDDSTDTESWVPVPNAARVPSLQVSGDEYNSGEQSLQLVVDLPPYETDTLTAYGGIVIRGEEFPDVKAIMAWVLVPKSGAVRDKEFSAHILAYQCNENDQSIGFISEDKQIEPGLWTPLFLGTFQATDLHTPAIKLKGEVNEVYVNVWSKQDYKGSIYIDDVVIFTEAAIVD